MLLIRTDSWHYRLYKYENNHRPPPTDLCSYVQGLMGTIAFIALRDLALASLVVLSGAVLVFIIVDLIASVGWGITILMAVSFPLAIALTFGAVIAGYKLYDRREKVRDKVLNYSAPRLLFNYIKAKKEKYCPLVEVVDSNESKRA